jgi:hypothetical protein
MDPGSLLLEGRKKAFQPPHNPEIKIWRYMDFMRLVNTLEEQGLFFRRTDLFEDRFEGSMSQPLRDFLEHGRQQVSPEDYSQMLRRVRLSSFVNSWHMNESESAAMWRLYSSTTEHAICLQSTYRRLRDSLPQDIYLGTVKYISYDRDQIPFDDLWWPLLHKRNSFEYERELRAVWSDIDSIRKGEHDDQLIGIFKQVDLQRLTESVYVSAESKPWFIELVKKVLRRYETDVPVRKSELASEPLFR